MLLRQIADLGDHVVDAVVQDVLILPETVDVPHEVVVTLNLRVGCVEVINASDRDSQQDEKYSKDNATEEVTQCMTGRGRQRKALFWMLIFKRRVKSKKFQE